MRKITFLVIILALSITSCKKDFLQLNPQGELVPSQLATPDGVESLLTGAYSLLNGNLSGLYGAYASAPSQWLWGEIAADDGHKGSVYGDQPPMNDIEQHAVTSTNANLSNIWNSSFEGIKRCNNTLKVLAELQSGSGPKLSDARATQIKGEARFLRAHYYFLVRRLFQFVPYVDETVPTTTIVPNDKDIYPNIEEDMQFAVDNLTVDKFNKQVGRANKTAAQAYLGKIKLYQHKYAEALPLFQSVITALPDLKTLPYTDNFDITKENGPESIFAVQHNVNDGTTGDNADVGDILNYPYGTGLPITCCGFFQPSIDLASAYRVDANGLPLLDTYQQQPVTSDFGLTGAAKTNYQPDRTLPVDTRLDYTLGRRGVPYRDWGLFGGDNWIRDPSNGGPYESYKTAIEATQIATGTAPALPNLTGLNVNLIRLADVYLMAAECSIEAGDLGNALTLVNAVRARAANIPIKLVGGTPIAAYKVGQYPSFSDADYARKAVRFERRLELAMEGYRFYDLVRWGIAQQTLNNYLQFEGKFIGYLKGVNFEARDQYYPLPQDQIDRSQGKLAQDKNY